MSEAVISVLTNLGLSVTTSALITLALLFMLRSTVKTSIEEGVKFGFSKALEEHKEHLSETLEAAKTALKFSETRFSKQFEALVAMRKYFRGLRPRKHFPEMNLEDAMSDLAGGLSGEFNKLDELLSAHEAVIPTSVLKALENAMTAAEDAQFEWDLVSGEDIPEPRMRAIELAGQFYKNVREAVEAMQRIVDEQLPARKV